MARGFYVNFKVPELQEAIAKIGSYNTKTAMKIEDAVNRATKGISKGARQRVSVASGDLKKSIRSRFDKKTITGYVAAKEYYAHFVEFGAKANAKHHIPKRAERPFMRPAFEDYKPTLIREITEAVRP